MRPATRPLRSRVLVGVAVAGGVVVVWAGAVLAVPARDHGDGAASRSREGTGPEAADEASPAVRSVPARPARRAHSLVRPERPVQVRLPSGTRVPVRPASTAADGRLDVPHDIRTAGWWTGGSRLGDPFGSMLVAAHIDSTTQGLGPYVQLLQVHPGQRVGVVSRHLVAEYRIRSLRLVPQEPLTRHRWVFSAAGPRRLTLVTCAPPFDRSRGGYQNLAVVTATPVGRPHRRGHS